MSESTQWFEQGLGARIDALAVALGAFHAQEDTDAEVVKKLARSLAGPAALHGYDAISTAARALSAAGTAEIDDLASALTALLRQEASKTQQAITSILVVGGEEAYNTELCEHLDYPSRTIICVDDASGADRALKTYDVVFIVLNLFLPDLDARTLFQRLQETPKTASIPAVVLAKELSEEVRADVEALNGDVLAAPLPAPQELATRINARLRRAHETAKEARRDPVTGLLNRAALRESFRAAVQESQETGIPVSLALISLDATDALFESLDATQRNTTISRVGSLLSSSLRSTDVLARWGTHEFAALFPGEDQVGGVQAVEKVVQAARVLVIPELRDQPLHLSLSAGVALAGGGSTLEDTIAEADRFLFQATSQGGNQVGSSQTPAPTRTEQVLLMIQDTLTCHVMQHLLERDGFAVSAINDLDTPLAAVVESKTFNLIVLDEALPPRGGFEVLKELRAMPRNSRTPMVMLIEQNSEDSMARALELGANDYMMRPFSPFTFIRRMRRLLKGGSRNLNPHVGGEICKVLLIDDDPRFLLLAATALHQRRGFQPFLALGADDGKARLAETAPDAVLMKAELNGDTDHAGVNEILTTCATRDAGVVLMTAKGADAVTGEAVKGIIETPINALSLGKQIEGALRMSRGTRHPEDATHLLNTEMQRITRLTQPAPAH